VGHDHLVAIPDLHAAAMPVAVGCGVEQQARENLVSACHNCNHRKGGKTIDEAKMVLRRAPAEPRATPQYLFQQYLGDYEAWRKFIPMSKGLDS
jgi:5-methylcytosine-specific restriction endonuclease McrA